jgi:hypothetical protein
VSPRPVVLGQLEASSGWHAVLLGTTHGPAHLTALVGLLLFSVACVHGRRCLFGLWFSVSLTLPPYIRVGRCSAWRRLLGIRHGVCVCVYTTREQAFNPCADVGDFIGERIYMCVLKSTPYRVKLEGGVRVFVPSLSLPSGAVCWHVPIHRPLPQHKKRFPF